jgi:hypothetical protein
MSSSHPKNNPQKSNEHIAMRITGASNVRIVNCKSVGMPLLEADNVANIFAKGSTTINQPLAIHEKPTIAQTDKIKNGKPSPDHWYKKPIPVVILGVMTGTILLCIRYIFIHYFGLSI